MMEVTSHPTATDVGAASGVERKVNWLWILLALMSLVNVWPILWFQYLPFMDHPTHLVQYNILAHRSAPEFGYDQFFAPTLLPVPNMLNDYLTALLAQGFTIDFAARFAIAGAMWLLPISIWFYLSRVRPGTEGWAFFSLPMAWSSFLVFGNENFCLAVPLLFFVLGLISDWKEPLAWRRVVPVILLCTAIYLAHFLVFAVAGLAVVLHAVFSDRSPRSLIQHLVTVVPGSLMFLVWYAFKEDKLPPVRTWEFNLPEKVNAFLVGVSPAPWGGAVQVVFWQCFLASLLILLSVGCWKLCRKGAPFIPVLVVSCWVIAMLLQRWTFIFIPDQRIWWLSILMGLALLPAVGSAGLLRIVIFAIPLAIGASVTAGRQFVEPNKQLAQLEEIFSKFPAKMRLLYFGDPSLPPHLHRAYEYYHIRKGGRSTMQFLGDEHSVGLAKGAFSVPTGPGLGIYDYSADAWLPYLDQFDGAMLIGNPSADLEKIIVALQVHGFRVVVSGGITLMVGPNWKQDAEVP